MKTTTGKRSRPCKMVTFAWCAVATMASLVGCDSAATSRTASSVTSRTSTGDSPVVHLTDQQFDEVVLAAEQPVLVDFWADWCGPCHQLAPVVSQYAAEAQGSAVVAKVDVDENASLADKYQIAELPTLVIFHRGKAVDRIVGVVDLAEIRAAMSQWVNSPETTDDSATSVD